MSWRTLQKYIEIAIENTQTQNNNLWIAQSVVPWVLNPQHGAHSKKRRGDNLNHYSIREV